MKVAKIAIFLTGMIGLAMGGMMSISSLRSQQQEAQIRTFDNLKSESQVLVDQLYGAIEATKNLSLNPLHNGSQNNLATSALPYVSHVGVVKLNQSLPVEFESLAARNELQLGVDKNGKALDTLPDLALEERVLKALKSTLSYGDLQISKIAIGTFELSDLSNKEGIFIATPIYKVTNGVTDPTLIDRINLTLLDPTKVMASFAKVTRDRRAAFLINKNGKVLAHSSNSFVGSELKKYESLKDPIENLFLGAQTGTATTYTSVNGQKEQVAFVRAGVYPFAVATEQTAAPAVLSSAWWSDQIDSGAARQNLGMALVICAIALAMFAGASVLVSRHLPNLATNSFRANRNAEANANFDRENTSNASQPVFKRWTSELRARRPDTERAKKPAVKANSEKLTTLTPDANEQAAANVRAYEENLNRAANTPPEFVPSAAISRAAERAAESFVESRAQLAEQKDVRQENAKRILVAKDYEREFTDRIKSNYTLETIERELTIVASELTESPVLYLRYHRQTQNLNLASVAGEVKIPNYALMQAYVRKDIEQQVERLASEGRVASIANYGPVNKLMIANLNTAHFEAWVVTSDAEISGNSKMVGVIVILQAGFRSAQTRPVLASILKEAGNYLYAQTSKLRPRRYDDPMTQSNRDLGLNA